MIVAALFYSKLETVGRCGPLDRDLDEKGSSKRQRASQASDRNRSTLGRDNSLTVPDLFFVFCSHEKFACGWVYMRCQWGEVKVTRTDMVDQYLSSNELLNVTLIWFFTHDLLHGFREKQDKTD